MEETEEKSIEQGDATELTREEKAEQRRLKREQEKKEDKQWRNGCLIAIGIIPILFLTGILSYTTKSCDLLPFDIVLFNRVCILTYLVIAIGGSLAIGLGFGLLALIVNGIELLFKKK